MTTRRDERTRTRIWRPKMSGPMISTVLFASHATCFDYLWIRCFNCPKRAIGHPNGSVLTGFSFFLPIPNMVSKIIGCTWTFFWTHIIYNLDMFWVLCIVIFQKFQILLGLHPRPDSQPVRRLAYKTVEKNGKMDKERNAVEHTEPNNWQEVTGQFIIYLINRVFDYQVGRFPRVNGGTAGFALT